MSLRSKLFGGDPKLEAAAVSDPAHITIGAKGEHVRKIQLALTLLDDANIDLDGAYGPETAAAVLDYKKKRNIINRSYQTQADDIVGKMTIASLDREMHQRERVPRPPIRIVPKSNWVMGSQRNPTLFTLARRSGSLALNASAIGTAPRFGQINLNIEPKELRLLPGTTGLITVEDGAPGTVQVIGDPFINAPPIVHLSDGLITSVGLQVVDNRQTFRVIAGPVAGTTMIVASLAIPDPDNPPPVAIEVTVLGNILRGRIQSAPAGSLGFDTDQPINLDVAKKFARQNFKFCLRYLSFGPHQGTGDLTTKEANQILDGGLALMPVQHPRNPWWVATAALGASDGDNAVKNARSVGFSPGVNVWVDLEGPGEITAIVARHFH